jgi:hypothetical protein
MKYLLSSGESHTFYITNMLADIDIGKATLEGAGYTPSMFLLADGTNIRIRLCCTKLTRKLLL